MPLHTDPRLLAVLGISDRCAFGAELRHRDPVLTRVEVRTRKACEVSNAEEKVERQHAWGNSANALAGGEDSGQPTKDAYEQLRCTALMWRTNRECDQSGVQSGGHRSNCFVTAGVRHSPQVSQTPSAMQAFSTAIAR